MDVFRTPSTPTSSELLPSYTLQTQSELDRQLSPDGPSASSPLPRPPHVNAAADEPANPWAREKGGRDLSAYRNSVILVDEESGHVLGVLGGEGGVVLEDEPSPLPSQGSNESGLSDEAVVGYSPVNADPSPRAEANDFLVNTNDTSSVDGASTLSPSLRRGFDELDTHLGDIAPFTPSPSIILTPSTSSSLPDGLPPPAPPPTPAFPLSKPPRPVSLFPDLRSSPSDISLRTMLSPGGLSIIGGLPGPEGGDPSNTTIRRVHSRRMRSGTVTSVGGSSFYTAREAEGGTWRGSVVGGSVRGTILARRGTVKGGGEAVGTPGGGDVLLRFFEERDLVFVASQPQQPATSSPLAQMSATPGLDSPTSSLSSLPTEQASTPSASDIASGSYWPWSYLSLPTQPLEGASVVWDASKTFFGGVWGMLDFSSPPPSSSDAPAPESGHGRYRSSFYYHPAPPPLDPDSLDATAKPVVMPKRARVESETYEPQVYSQAQAREASVWHVDEAGVGRRAWINPVGGWGGLGGMNERGFY